MRTSRLASFLVLLALASCASSKKTGTSTPSQAIATTDSVVCDSVDTTPSPYQKPPRDRSIPPSERDTLSDTSIILPEAMDADIDSLLGEWYAESYVRFDTTCVSSKALEVLPDSIYIERLYQMPTLIEMPFNPIVAQYIDTYTRRARKLSEYLLGASAFYFPLFEQELERAGAPQELKYLPLIESALKPDATSRAGAAGLWQFMVATGKMYGLEVNSLVDERRDPIKSTREAVRYLCDLHDIYNDWTLAIAAYNCGPGNVNKAIRRAGDKRDYWQIYYYLPRETRGYVPAFIAATYMMHYAEEHQICPAMVNLPLVSDTLMVDKEIDMQEVASALQLSIEELRLLNPQYRNDIVPGHIKPYALRLPGEAVYAFIDEQDSIVSRSAQHKRKVVKPTGYTASAGSLPSGSYSYHTIRSGESLSTIAAKYGVSVTTLKQWNGLYGTRITAGKKLRIYGKSAAKSTTAVAAKSSAPSQFVNWKGGVTYYTVGSGDNLWSIARKYPGVSADNIKDLNGFRSNSLKPGQRIKIPVI